MRKYVILNFFVISGLLIASPFAHARTWFVENARNAVCQELPINEMRGIDNPSDFIDALRRGGVVPNIEQNKDENGNLSSVAITYSQGTNTIGINFFLAMTDCQNKLNKDIKDGIVIDNSSLK